MTRNSTGKIEIIAELGQGFEGRPEQARLLIRAAASSGADAAKFQLVYADELATMDYKHYELFRTLEMDDAIWQELASYARKLGISLDFDVFGARSVALADRLGAGALKVHSTDIANVALLRLIAATDVPTILLGAGGALLSEVEQAIRLLAHKAIVVLLGFQGYPTSTADNQIARVRLLGNLLCAGNPSVSLGFADHAFPESPLRYALAATALGAGARVFEKHLTLGEVMKMEDHEAALNPDRFDEFVRVLRDCGEAFGEAKPTADFDMSSAEQGYRKAIRRQVVARRPIAEGSRIGPEDLELKRTSHDNGLTDLAAAYGAIARKDLARNEPIHVADLMRSGAQTRES